MRVKIGALNGDRNTRLPHRHVTKARESRHSNQLHLNHIATQKSCVSRLDRRQHSVCLHSDAALLVEAHAVRCLMQAWNAFAHNNRYKRRWRHRIRARLRRGFRLVSERHKGKKKKKKKKKRRRRTRNRRWCSPSRSMSTHRLQSPYHFVDIRPAAPATTAVRNLISLCAVLPTHQHSKRNRTQC
jgi:hypothetical protein